MEDWKVTEKKFVSVTFQEMSLFTKWIQVNNMQSKQEVENVEWIIKFASAGFPRHFI